MDPKLTLRRVIAMLKAAEGLNMTAITVAMLNQSGIPRSMVHEALFKVNDFNVYVFRKVE